MKLCLAIVLIAQIAGYKGTGKSFAIKWIDNTQIVFRVTAPVNRLARIDVTENMVNWSEVSNIWTGPRTIYVSPTGGTFTASVICYPPTDAKGSVEQIYTMFPTLETNRWTTIYQTNNFFRNQNQTWRMRLQ